MLEYIFFDERPWTRFIEYLQQRGLAPHADREEQGFMVRLPEDADDALWTISSIFTMRCSI